MAVKPNDTGGATTPNASVTTGAIKSVVAGTNTTWHTVVLWFLGAVALLALADPAPNIALMLVFLIILGTLLNNWNIYAGYLGISNGKKGEA